MEFLIVQNANQTLKKEVISIEKTSQIKIPFWERYTLSIEEAAAYFRIGENKLRKIISEDKDADFVLWNGTRSQIKRKKFENYIDRLNVI